MLYLERNKEGVAALIVRGKKAISQYLTMATPYPPGPSGPAPGSPCSKVELSVSCKDLLDTDFFSKSDPIAVVYTGVKVQGTLRYTEVQLVGYLVGHVKLVCGHPQCMQISSSCHTAECIRVVASYDRKTPPAPPVKTLSNHS